MKCPDCGQEDCTIQIAWNEFDQFHRALHELNEDQPELDTLDAIPAYTAWWGDLATEWTDPEGNTYQLPPVVV